MQDAHVEETSLIFPASGATEFSNNTDLYRRIVVIVRSASGCRRNQVSRSGCMMREVAQPLSGQAAASALSCIDPIWSGAVAYRSLINAEKLRDCAPHHPSLRKPVFVSWISNLDRRRLISSTQYLGKDSVSMRLINEHSSL